MRLWKFSIMVFGLGAAAADAFGKKLVVLASIDGRPDCALEAEAYGLKIPHLRLTLADGSYAAYGILPTITYPRHTTLVTGVSHARHEICASRTFDPEGCNQDE